MTYAASRPEPSILLNPTLAQRVDHIRPIAVPPLVNRISALAGDLLGAMAIVLAIPFVILAIGVPLALCVRFVLWIVAML